MLYGDGSGKITTASSAQADVAGNLVEFTVKDIRPFKIGDIISIATTAQVTAVKGKQVENGAGVEFGGADYATKPEAQYEKSLNR